ncbi:ornithine cyclodeaminase family protein [Puteibacter caeruleilacunae]|nr:ornithine cyclodeaminase family protein [Puteibacter caeruleilacunae]
MQFINKDQIQHTLSMKACTNEMRKLFMLNQETDIIVPLRNKMSIQDNNLLGMMPACIIPYQIMGIKVTSVFPDNYKKGISSHQGLIQLFNMSTGEPLACIDADEITAIRTAAVSAVATHQLAREDSSSLCLLGSGTQAKKHLEAILNIRDIKNVTVWSNVAENDKHFAITAANKYHLPITPCKSAKEAVQNADIICTTTSSAVPIIQNDWLKPSAHINAVGACFAGSRELSSDIIHNSKVIVDNYISATNEAGDIIIPANEKSIETMELIYSDLHDLLTNTPRDLQSEQTVFKSVGIATEDLAAAWFCYNNIHKNDSFYTNSCIIQPV